MKNTLNRLLMCACFAAVLCTVAFAAPSMTALVEDVGESAVELAYETDVLLLSDTFYADGISFTVDENMTLTVSGEGKIKKVPSQLLGERFNKLVIESGITEVAENAFAGFDSIALVVASDTLKYVGKGAFDGTKHVETKTGPVYIGKVFYTYKGEIDGQIPLTLLPGTVGVAENALFGRTEIDKVTLPQTVRVIGENAFYGCTSLAEIDFSDNIEYVGENAFSDTAWEDAQTETVVIGKTLYKYIGTDETYEIPDGIEYISGRAFSGNDTVSTLVIGDIVKYICSNAFYGCEKLENITFGNAIERIGENAFFGTKWLASKPGGVVYVNDIAVLYKGEMQEYARVEIQEGTRIVESGIFRDRRNLYSLVIPESVELIGDDALAGCLNVTVYAKSESYAEKYALDNSIPVREDENTDETVSSGVSGLVSWTLYESGKLVFAGEGSISFPSEIDRNSVTAVEMSEGITEISEEAFMGCNLLSRIAFPESLECVGAFAFDSTMWLDSKQGEVYTGNILYTYVGDVEGGVLEVRDGTTHVSDFALSGNTSLAAVVLPDSLVYVGEEAFSDCENLETVTGGANVEYVGADALFATKFLEEKTGEVYIGKTLYAYNGDVPSGTVFEIDDGTVSVSPFACFGLVGISDIVFPESLKELGTESFAFCKGLGNLELPDSIEKFGENVFGGCENITLVVNRPSAAHEYAKQSGTPFIADGITLFGDVDGDGNLSIKDLILLAQYVSGGVTLDDEQLKIADVYTDNGETGVVNRNDINRLGESLAGNKTVLG